MNLIENKKYLLFFACCLPVKGYRRAAIIDLQRPNIYFVPNDLVDVFNTNQEKAFTEILNEYDNENRTICIEYANYLIENELVFVLDSHNEIDFFPKLNLQWDFPGYISNAILEIGEDYFVLDNVAKQLENLGCIAISIFIYKDLSLDELKRTIEYFNMSNIQFIELHLNYNTFLQNIAIDELISTNLRVTKFNIYNLQKNTNKIFESELSKISVNEERLAKFPFCQNPSFKNFTINISFFTESQQHNTCLNRKICIDVNGEIKNCPSMKQSFGNIKDTTLKEALEKPGFKDLWFICKDQIDVCKDCEFRHICTDCRAFIKDPENIYSQPAKCTYNPYIAKWQGQEGYITVEQWREETKNEKLNTKIEK